MKRNIFIAFEGIDGCGKSTQAKILSEKLQQAGHSIYTTFEPTKNPIGTLIRKIMMHEMEGDNRTIAALFAADRLDHILHSEYGMQKKLTEGNIVICDRYYLSSFAYQGVFSDLNWLQNLNNEAMKLLKPDLTFYIDIPAEESYNRITQSRSHRELFETLENLKKVKANYSTLIKKYKTEDNIVAIDGNLPVEQVTEKIWIEVERQISFSEK